MDLPEGTSKVPQVCVKLADGQTSGTRKVVRPGEVLSNSYAQTSRQTRHGDGPTLGEERMPYG